MNILIILMVLIIVAIVVLNAKALFEPKTREMYLADASKFFGKEWQPIEGQPSSFRIELPLDNRIFTFEDVEQKGFTDVAYKGYLRVDLRKPFTMYFMEKEGKTTVRSDIITVSSGDVSAAGGAQQSVSLPHPLSRMNIYTSDPAIVTSLVTNKKVIPLLTEFTNIDSRGCHSMSLKINKGSMVLEFGPLPGHKPARKDVYHHPSVLVKYAQKMDFIARVIEQGVL